MAVTAFPESLHLVETALLARTQYGAMCFGDTDHDGKREAASSDRISGLWFLHMFESQGGTAYSDEYIGAPDIIPYALCDLDRDGKGEVMGQVGFQVLVYEAFDHSSYPSQLVWSSPDLSNVVGHATIGDTDLDGKLEIIQSASSFGDIGYLCIFENEGDNSFAWPCTLQVTGGAMGKKAIGDLDLDGIPEIAFSTLYGGIYVVKSTGNNAWRIQWTITTGLRNVYGACIGPDLDGNGKPELFIAGARSQGWTTLVLESSGVGQYAIVDTLTQYDGWFGQTVNTVGDFTGSGRHEYAMQGHDATWIYGASGLGNWELISTLPDYDNKHQGLYGIDLNQNGRDELFWGSDALASVYEHRGLVSDLPFASNGPAPLRVSPNPVRGEATLQVVAGVSLRGRLCVYDVAGRLVQRLPLLPDSPQTRLRTDGFGAGVYFVEIEGSQGKPIARGQVTVVR